MHETTSENIQMPFLNAVAHFETKTLGSSELANFNEALNQNQESENTCVEVIRILFQGFRSLLISLCPDSSIPLRKYIPLGQPDGSMVLVFSI